MAASATRACPSRGGQVHPSCLSERPDARGTVSARKPIKKADEAGAQGRVVLGEEAQDQRALARRWTAATTRTGRRAAGAPRRAAAVCRISTSVAKARAAERRDPGLRPRDGVRRAASEPQGLGMDKPAAAPDPPLVAELPVGRSRPIAARQNTMFRAAAGAHPRPCQPRAAGRAGRHRRMVSPAASRGWRRLQARSVTVTSASPRPSDRPAPPHGWSRPGRTRSPASSASQAVATDHAAGVLTSAAASGEPPWLRGSGAYA